MFGLGIGELLIIVVLFVLFFGAKRLPELGGSLGKAISQFKKGLNQPEDEKKKELPPSDHS